ncbi:MAG: PA14 domain-containing protein, partial [Bacteroidota bacterium]|nr:PA14 domain-containing protein [Bacteroidota bacterium]
LNLDSARGTTWEVVPQDPWSYVATRIRFNADGSIDALVIDNEYESHWRRVPAEVPAGYFDLALEYNSAGSDTSGFPTYLLFINNQHVFSGTGLAPGIGQLAIASPMESAGSTIDIDELQIRGGEYIPDFIRVEPADGIVRAGESVNFSVQFDASLMKFGTYESDVILHLDEVDSLVVPATLSIPGGPSFFTDVYSVYWVLEKNEIGSQEMTLTNDGGQILEFNMKTDLPGLTVNPASGTLGIRQDEVVELRYDGPPGIFQSEIVINATGGIDAHVVPVNITRMDSGAVFYAPNEVTFDVPAGEISKRTLEVRNNGINTVSFTTTMRDGDTTIQVDPPMAVLKDEPLVLTLTIDASQLQPGSTGSAIRFTTNDPDRRLVETVINLNLTSQQQLCASAGQITREQWNGISGDRVSSIPLDQAPSSLEALTLFESPSNIRDNYGARIRGFLCVPQSGKYTFWIASNDHSELWLSTDTNPLNKKRIAYVPGYTNPRQWTKFASQQSAVVYLESGKKYYIEALHKEGIGTDHLAVGWQMPDGTLERPKPGIRLIPYEEVIAKCTASGTITREFWTGTQGNLVSSIPLDDSPQGVESLTNFEGPINAGINYGARVRGYICPPETGEYYFWIASNDHSELWLSTDEDAANRVMIASIHGATNVREWNKFRSQKSAPILLIRGKTYYIEALHKQGIGTDHIAVGWQLPDGTLERPVPGSRLSPIPSLAQHLVDDSEPDEPLEEMSVSIFPNPLTGERLNIVVSNVSTEAGPGEVFIHELTGLPVYHRKLSCESGCEAEIDVAGKFKPGIYLLLIRQGGRTITEKLVVP